METRSQLTVVYVLTTSGQDPYSDMALVSALSVRQSNPGLRIAIVSDGLTAEALKRSKHPLLKVVDEFRVVDAPYESAVHRNRSIKTRLYELCAGPTLNLDVDTIVRGSLAQLIGTQCDFGAVANHNGLTPQDQLWSEDAGVISAMRWQVELPCYINTGVIFYRPSAAVADFYSRWHALWSEEREKTGRGRDQPSCYAALQQTGLQCFQLSPEYNWQVLYKPLGARGARILHFYPDAAAEKRSFGQAVRVAREVSLRNLNVYVRACIERPEESIYQDPISRWLKSRVARGIPIGVAANLWLMGRRSECARFYLGGVRRSLWHLIKCLWRDNVPG